MYQEQSGKGVGLSIGILRQEDHGVQQGIGGGGQAVPRGLGRWPSPGDGDGMGAESGLLWRPSCQGQRVKMERKALPHCSQKQKCVKQMASFTVPAKPGSQEAVERVWGQEPDDLSADCHSARKCHGTLGQSHPPHPPPWGLGFISPICTRRSSAVTHPPDPSKADQPAFKNLQLEALIRVPSGLHSRPWRHLTSLPLLVRS